MIVIEVNSLHVFPLRFICHGLEYFIQFIKSHRLLCLCASVRARLLCVHRQREVFFAVAGGVS